MSIDRLTTDLDELHGRMTDAERKLIEHDTRFSNGREVMNDIKTEVKTVQDKIQPKAPDWLKLGAFAMSVVVALLSGHYWINERFNDRPTAVQIEKIMGSHGMIGHAETHKDISDIRQIQAAQATSLDTLNTAVANQGSKLDTIIERLPQRRSGR